MSDPRFLVCPACERAEPATDRAPCPACGSDRTYLHHAPALPDSTVEAYVKLDAEDAAREGESQESSDSSESSRPSEDPESSESSGSRE